MYAIVEIAGKQYKVRENDKLFVPHLADAKVDDTIEFDRVLLFDNDGDVKVGAPVLADATISATVLEHVKADKVLVFRKIRRKRFRVKRGHRQRYTQIEISGLSLNGADKQAATAKKSAAAEAKATEAKEAKAAEAKEAKAAEAKEAKAAEAKEAKAAEAKEAKAAEAKEAKAAEAKEAKAAAATEADADEAGAADTADDEKAS